MIDVFCLENGVVREYKGKDLPRLRNKQLWVDVQKITSQEQTVLKDVFNLHSVTVEDFSGELSQIKVEEFSHYLFCIFYGLEKATAAKLEEFNFVLGKNFLITNHKSDLFKDFKSEKDKLVLFLKHDLDFFFYHLLDRLVDSYFPVLNGIEDKLDLLEREATTNPKKEFGTQILYLKRQISLLRKYVFPQRDKISLLAGGQTKFITEKVTPYYRNLYNHAIRISDFVDNARDEADTTFEIYMSAVSNNMNEVMKFLSIIATIAMPLTVISGIYGTSFRNLPGADVNIGFWVMILVMVLVSMVMIINFKKKKWF